MTQTSRSGPSWRARLIPCQRTLVVLLGLCLEGSASGAESRIDTELLELAASTHEANIDRLRTWSGRVRVTMSMGAAKEAEGPARERTSTLFVSFYYDRTKQAKRWAWTHEGSERRFPVVRDGMIKEGVFYRSGPIKPGPNEGSRRFTIESPYAISPDPMPKDFDATYWFTDHGSPLTERFRAYCVMVEKGHNPDDVVVSRDGERVILELGGNDVLNRLTVDLSEGGLFVAYDGESSGVAERWRYQNEQVAGVWVPKEISQEVINSKAGRRVALELEWLENRVNEPIAAEEFTLAKIGIRRGDRIYDHRSGSLQTVTSEEYRSPEDSEEADIDDQKPPASKGPLLAWLGAGLLILIAVVVGVRRRYRARGAQR